MHITEQRPHMLQVNTYTHRRSQGGQRVHAPPKLLVYLVTLCFKRRPKQNTVAIHFLLSILRFGQTILCINYVSFFLFLVTATGDSPKPELCFLQGRLR